MRIAKFGHDRIYTLYPFGMKGFDGAGNVLAPIVLSSGLSEEPYSPYSQGRRIARI